MKIKDLVNYWDKHARGRLTRDAYFMALSGQHHKRLEKLAALYPMKSPQDLMRDLISANNAANETGDYGVDIAPAPVYSFPAADLRYDDPRYW